MMKSKHTAAVKEKFDCKKAIYMAIGGTMFSQPNLCIITFTKFIFKVFFMVHSLIIESVTTFNKNSTFLIRIFFMGKY